MRLELFAIICSLFRQLLASCCRRWASNQRLLFVALWRLTWKTRKCEQFIQHPHPQRANDRNEHKERRAKRANGKTRAKANGNCLYECAREQSVKNVFSEKNVFLSLAHKHSMPMAYSHIYSDLFLRMLLQFVCVLFTFLSSFILLAGDIWSVSFVVGRLCQLNEAE